MKKWMAMLLCCALIMGLAACGAGSGGPKGSDSPQERALHFEVVTQTYEDAYKAEDGTVLLVSAMSCRRLNCARRTARATRPQKT